MNVLQMPLVVRAQGDSGERLAARSANPPHALLLCGPPGCDSEHIARWWAGTVVGTAEDRERNLRLASEGTHPDVVDVVAVGATFSVNEDIRDHVLVEARRAPSEGERKVIIIHEAERLADAPANALLRTLEEPPPWVVFVLTTARPSAVLATIRSRCELFSLQAISADVVVEVLSAEGVGEQLARTAVAQVGANIERARMVAGPYRALIDASVASISRLDGTAHSALLVSAELSALLDESMVEVDHLLHRERERLSVVADQFSPRSFAALTKRLEARHVRARRKARTQALVEALLAFERTARDGLAGGESGRRGERVLQAAYRARLALSRNVSESLVIESFLMAVL